MWKRYQFIIILIIVFPSFIVNGKEKSKYFFNPKKYSLNFCYDMGVLDIDNKITVGGLVGLNAGFNYRLFKFSKILGFFQSDITFNFLSSTLENSEYEDGIYDYSVFSDFGYDFSMMISNFDFFVGYRRYNGTRETEYDWWQDYTSKIAWDPNYVNYYWYEKNSVKLRGYEFGLRYHFFFIRDNIVPYDFTIQFKILKVDLIIEKVNFYYLSTIFQPNWGYDYIYVYIEGGFCPALNGIRLKMGVGYLL